MVTKESVPPKLLIIHLSQCHIWRSQVTKFSKWCIKDRETAVICKSQMESFKCVFSSFNDAEGFMRCCRETVLVRANQQQGNTTSCQRESTERQQQEMEIHLTGKTEKQQWQQREKKHQQLQAGKTKDSSAQVSVSSQKKISLQHCKFQSKLKACFICRWSPQS